MRVTEIGSCQSSITLDFGLLLVLDGALRHRKLATVAKRLNLTQSAVSHALARLRDVFDDPLFVRRPHGVEPTPRALELAEPVAAILSLADGVLTGPAAFDPKASRRVFRIAAPDQETALFAPALMRAAAGTGIGFSFKSQVRDAAMKSLLEGEIDFAMGYFWRPQDGIERQALYEESYAVVLRADHPAAAEPFTPQSYAGLEHVLVSPGGDLRGVVDDKLAEQGLQRRVVAAVPYFFAAFASVAEGTAVATLPRRLAERHALSFGLVVRDPPVEVRRFPVHLAWTVRNRADFGLAWVREQISASVG